jgi:putrescine aminotransferase
LIGALELVKDKAKRQAFAEPGEVGVICRDLCIANGLVMRAVRDTMIIAPPLVITHAQIDELVEKARLALDQTRDTLVKQGKL